MLWVYNFTIPPGTLKDSETFKEMLERMANESESELGGLEDRQKSHLKKQPPTQPDTRSGFVAMLKKERQKGRNRHLSQVKSRSKLEFQVFHFVQRPGHV